MITWRKSRWLKDPRMQEKFFKIPRRKLEAVKNHYFCERTMKL